MKKAYIIFAIFLTLNLIGWMAVRYELAIWINVPPPPEKTAMAIGSLGDTEMAYRSIGFMLQNMGDHGGETRNIDTYDFDRLKQWFFLADSLNQRSDYVPFLAAYYYGAAKSTDNIGRLVEFLGTVGQRPYAEKWRWLSWSITAANQKLNDLDTAIYLANHLKNIKVESKPAWADRLVPALYSANGRKADAQIAAEEVFQDNFTSFPYQDQVFMLTLLCSKLADYNKQNPRCFNYFTDNVFRNDEWTSSINSSLQ